MPEVLANELADKRVLSTDGQEIGTLHNVRMDIESGTLETLVVVTDRRDVFGIATDADGRVHLPAATLEAVSDHVVVTPPE